MEQKTAARLVSKLGLWEAKALGLPKSKRTDKEAREWMGAQVSKASFRNLMGQIIHPDCIASA